MDAATLARYEARARIIKALAHPARLMIVDELSAHKERCVCELTELVGADMSTVSRHLAQLKVAGIVQDERRGKMTYYRLSEVSEQVFWLRGVRHAQQCRGTRVPCFASMRQ